MIATVAPDVLKSFPLFAGMAEQERSDLIGAGRLRRYKAGQHLFLYGDPAQLFYVICDGTVQLSRETPDGHEMTAELLIKGDTIGKVTIFRPDATHEFTAIAVKETTTLEFPMGWFQEMAKNHGILALNLLEALSRHLQIATIEAEHKATMTAAQQVACFFERLCALYGFNPHGFELPYSKTLIASRLGMELETFSRALAKIRDHGIVIHGTHVSFDNERKMDSFVCANCSIFDRCREHEWLSCRLHEGGRAHAT